ncbi:hypothetical protein, partial [Escherichia coli]|uniref:hypothetical protein n=1 Tax=Escherichia coli TaxID=562 RepID=UPI003D009A6D
TSCPAAAPSRSAAPRQNAGPSPFPTRPFRWRGRGRRLFHCLAQFRTHRSRLTYCLASLFVLKI